MCSRVVVLLVKRPLQSFYGWKSHDRCLCGACPWVRITFSTWPRLGVLGIIIDVSFGQFFNQALVTSTGNAHHCDFVSHLSLTIRPFGGSFILHKPRTEPGSTFSTTMSLILTIFAIVFFTQLISWIGKTVLLDLVGSILPN